MKEYFKSNPSIMEEIEKQVLEQYDRLYAKNSVSSNLENPIVDPSSEENE